MTFSWWDYRMLAFPKNHGLRIDHILLSARARRALHREPHRPQRAQGREAVRPRAGAWSSCATDAPPWSSRRRSSCSCSCRSTLAAYFVVPRRAAQRRAAGREPRVLRVGRGAVSRAGARRRCAFNYAIGARDRRRRRRRAAQALAGARRRRQPAGARRSSSTRTSPSPTSTRWRRSLGVTPLARRRRSRCRSASRSSRSTRSPTSSTCTSGNAAAPSATCRASRSTSCSFRSSSPARSSAGATSPRSSRAREQRLADFAYGVRRFVLGPRQEGAHRQHAGRARPTASSRCRPRELTTPLAWLGLVCYTLQIYFDFSGYSDMAIGLMRMFGFRILENFNYPYIARSRSASSGGAGTSRCRTGSATTSTSRSAATSAARARAYVNLVDRVPPLRPVARRELAVRAVGRVARRVPGRRARRARPRAAQARPARARLRAAGRDGRLGALPLRDARRRRSRYYAALLGRAQRRSGAPSARASSSIRSSLFTLVVGDRVRDAARAPHRALARSPRAAARCTLRRSTSRGSSSCSCSRARSSRRAPTIRSSTSGSDD